MIWNPLRARREGWARLLGERDAARAEAARWRAERDGFEGAYLAVSAERDAARGDAARWQAERAGFEAAWRAVSAERDTLRVARALPGPTPSAAGATLVFGHSIWFEETAALAAAAGHRPAYVLAPHFSDRPPSAVPVIPIELVDWSNAAAVIVLDAPERGEDGEFAANLARLLPLVPATLPILHPAALALGPGVARPGHWALTGFAGSGNVLAQSVLRALQDDADLPSGLARHLGDAQALTLRRSLQACFRTLPGFACHFGPGRAPDRLGVTVTWDHGWFVLNGLPYAGFLERSIGTHADWTAATQARLEGLGYRCFAVLRHPLDAIQSALAKLGRTGAEAMAGGPMLERIALLHRAALEAALRDDARLAFIRFETLLADPVGEIIRLGALLGKAVAPARAEALRDALLFRDLVNGPAPHLRDPLGTAGRGFTTAALDLLERLGTRAIADRLGYDWPEQRGAALDLPALDRPALRHAPLELLAGASCQLTELPGLELHAETASILDTVRALLALSPLPRLCRSLGEAPAGR